MIFSLLHRDFRLALVVYVHGGWPVQGALDLELLDQSIAQPLQPQQQTSQSSCVGHTDDRYLQQPHLQLDCGPAHFHYCQCWQSLRQLNVKVNVSILTQV